ncbi:ArnT family glycosyltransferase [Pedobacter faecalis]|uniref:ArnT family glycosyltransferase n=1 Tax=Pedobacter faecalis TaxID=3041495 RepID=UPI00254DED71|nr:glycosyltransferase family 39 protein [Pedobacter sp. ELA7]
MIKTNRLLFVFLAIWTVVNLLQAAFVELHADEAYYWMYSRFLDWGYFDHPPMVAVFIKAGDALIHSELGLRLLTVISSTFSVYLLWLILKQYGSNARLFVCLFASVVLFHVYGFITTPDSPLFFFTILFFYVYQRYLERDSWRLALLLALIVAAMLYSKYHGILVLFFTIVANYRILRRPSFWGIVLVALLCYLPHILWQMEHGYPSFYYHVIDRSADVYRFSFTSEYLLAQLALAGPLVGWFIYAAAVRLKSTDDFTRALQFNCYGLFLFFLVSTLKGRVEAHWTLPALLCLFLLAYIQLAGRQLPAWFEKLAVANIVLIGLVRLALVVPVEGFMKFKPLAYYFGNASWAREVHAHAGRKPVIFFDSFQIPSWYNYYTRSTNAIAYNSRNYRRNQYDLWPMEEDLQNRRAYVVTPYSRGESTEDTIQTSKGVYYGSVVDSIRSYQKLSIKPESMEGDWKAGADKVVDLLVSNPYPYPVSLSNDGQKWKCYLEYGFKKDGVMGDFQQVLGHADALDIAPGATERLVVVLKAPASPGKYKLVFSLRTEPFNGPRNSSMISVDVR